MPKQLSNQIGDALGFKNHHQSVDKLHKSIADEFTEHMTQLIDPRTAGGLQKARIFSLRGAHLLGMLVKTVKAKACRQ